MSEWYILDENHSPVPSTVEQHSDWLRQNFLRKVVGKTRIPKDGIVVEVSTVFLGLNHAWEDGTPILFETMIFGGEHDSFQDRYYTYEEALIGHLNAIDMVRK